MKYHSLLLTMALLVAATLLQAQESLVAPVTRTIVLKNANIVPQPGQMIERGTVVIKNGLIEAVGKDVKMPTNAKVIDADSMYVYAGFIDGLSTTGVPRPENEQSNQRGQQNRAEDPGNPPNELAGILPERDVQSLLKMDDRSVDEMRKLGFTAVHAVPNGQMLPGKGAIILLHEEAPVIRTSTALFSQLAGARGVYPATVIAVMSKWRELYKQAEQAKAHETMYQKSPSGMARPNYSETMRAFYPVIDKAQPVFFAADDLKSIYRVFELQNDLGFSLILGNVKQGWQVADLIKSKNVPVFLSLDLPTAKKADEKKKEEKEEKVKSITEMEMEALEKRRAEEMKKYETQAAEFAKRGITFGFSAMDLKSKDFKANLRRMIDGGLNEETALAALTTNPAKMLGLSAMMGTIEKGKMGNLVVSDKPFFDEKANVRYVFVDGKMYEYEGRAAKAGDPNATAKPSGRWSYTMAIPGQEVDGLLELTDENGTINGTLSNRATNQNTPIQNARISGNLLTFSTTINYGGQSVTLDYELLIDGDFFEGTVNIADFGSFDVEGQRDPGQE